MDLNSESESEEAIVDSEVEATLELHEGEDEDEGVGHTKAAEAARRQAEAEGLTLLPSTNKAGYRRVYYASGSSHFSASVQRAGKKVHLGSFSTAEDAALAVARAAARAEVASLKPPPLTHLPAKEAEAQAAAEGLRLAPSDGASGYKGVNMEGSRYHARLMRDGKRAHLGSFISAEWAALAVARAVARTSDSSPCLAAAKRATQPPKPPPAKQSRSSLAASSADLGVNLEAANPNPNLPRTLNLTLTLALTLTLPLTLPLKPIAEPAKPAKLAAGPTRPVASARSPKGRATTPAAAVAGAVVAGATVQLKRTADKRRWASHVAVL